MSYRVRLGSQYDSRRASASISFVRTSRWYVCTVEYRYATGAPRFPNIWLLGLPRTDLLSCTVHAFHALHALHALHADTLHRYLYILTVHSSCATQRQTAGTSIVLSSVERWRKRVLQLWMALPSRRSAQLASQ